jgi:protein-S-isoprenylcysteine O-methyltransferase Ste14
MTTTSQSRAHSDAVPDVPNFGLIRPPLVYLASLVIGALIQLAMPLAFLPRRLNVTLGAFLVVVAMALFLFSVAKFRAAGTPVPARKPTTVIVRTGPYRFSRNPIYLSFSLLQLGIAIWANSVWLRGHARRGCDPNALRRHTERRAVPGTEIWCAVLGL